MSESSGRIPSKTALEAQKELDRFWAKRKSKAEIGRLYECYIGYLHEKQGYQVEYSGIDKGLEDRGRDLICRRGKDTRIIQCKNWGRGKVIHEKYIQGLSGSVSQYAQHYPGEKVLGYFFTTVEVSDYAREAASDLKISICDSYKMPKSFPIIKCIASSRRYYLPTDKGYYEIRTDLSNGDRYFEKVGEAEKYGFHWVRKTYKPLLPKFPKRTRKKAPKTSNPKERDAQIIKNIHDVIDRHADEYSHST